MIAFCKTLDTDPAGQVQAAAIIFSDSLKQTLQ